MAEAYQRMIIASNGVPICYNLAASVASWIMLAGFFILPGTFTSLREQSHTLKNYHVTETIINIPLLPLAGICYFTGLTGLAFLWFKFKSNYIWILNHLF